MKRILSITLVLSMLLALCPLGAFAATASGTCGDNVTWSFDADTGTLTISGEGDMEDFEEHYDGGYYASTPWQEYKDSILYVVIDKNVTSISGGAFYECENMISVDIPDSVTSIEMYAFYKCSDINAVYITDMKAWANIDFANAYTNPMYFGADLYLNNVIVTDLVIPDGVTSIGTYAFSGCTSITNVTIPNSTTSIGDYAFYNCSSLTSVTIPNGVTEIGNYAFHYCTNLTSVVIPDSVSTVGLCAFEYCFSLTNVTISDSVTKIGDCVFFYCSSLTSVTIPDGVTSIGRESFYNCSSLKSITIPDSATDIGMSAFYGCGNLKTVIYTGTEEAWNLISISRNNDPILNAEIIFYTCKHEKYTWIVNDAKERVCKACGEVLETLGIDEYIPNDINGDDKINMLDCMQVKSYFFNLVTLTDDQFARADITGDGKVNMFDYMKIKLLVFAQ